MYLGDRDYVEVVELYDKGIITEEEYDEYCDEQFGMIEDDWFDDDL